MCLSICWFVQQDSRCKTCIAFFEVAEVTCWGDVMFEYVFSPNFPYIVRVRILKIWALIIYLASHKRLDMVKWRSLLDNYELTYGMVFVA